MLKTVASKMTRTCNSPHQITPLSATSVNCSGSQYNLAASEGDLHSPVDRKGTRVNQKLRRKGFENWKKKFYTGKQKAYASGRDCNMSRQPCGFPSTLLTQSVFSPAPSPWAWISLHWKNRCGPFAGCVHSSMSLYWNSQGQDCIIQHPTHFCAQTEHRSLQQNRGKQLKHSCALEWIHQKLTRMMLNILN